MKQRECSLMKKWGLSVVSMIAGGLAIFVMLGLFNLSTERIMEEFVRSGMDDLNKSAMTSMNTNFDRFTSMLAQEGKMLGLMQDPTEEQILGKLREIADREGFKNVAVLTFDGKVYSSFRGMAELRPEDSTPNLQAEVSVVSQPRVFHDGSIVIDISTPLKLNGEGVGKLVVSLDSDYLAKMLPDNLGQDGDTAFNLITGDGTLITRVSRRPSLMLPGDNIFDFYSKPEVQFIDGSNELLRDAMAHSLPQWVKYSIGEEQTIGISYMPFGRNNWYIATAVSGSTLYAQSRAIQGETFKLMLGIMPVIVAVSIVVVIQRIKEQQRIDTLKNTYSIAIRKTNDLFYEADTDNDMFTDYSEQSDKAVWGETPKNYSNAMMQVADACAPEFREQFLSTFLPHNIRIKMEEGISSINFEYKVTPDEHTERWFSATFVPVKDGSKGTKLICMENDITEQVMMHNRLKKSASVDGLTGLYNKTTTQEYIDWFLKEEGSEGVHALAVIDIDSFKWINDNMGHAKGDYVIAETGTMLKNVFRKSDIVGRIGGDEFAVFIKDYSTRKLIVDKMDEVKAAMNRVYTDDTDPAKTVLTSASIGIARYPEDGLSFMELYKAADAALYQSKANGKNCYTFHT